ncbi:F-box/WD repeat-containing protein 15-like [Mastomys coucha]|uniref:F-box/WD repeat-containing protein 15-like n=1 Tax=Mastomys coucha TaxID=35658 RepID=UPI001261DF1A|nr:F-box/WD repeat-containing protein 15-like [Mastomys coucha]
MVAHNFSDRIQEETRSDLLGFQGSLMYIYRVLACACYISRSGLTRRRQGGSLVCMMTSLTKISTWDIHEGVMTWASPEQPASIKLLTTLPEMHMAVTVDIRSTIKLWDCQSREALAINNLLFPCISLKAVFTKDGPIVLAGDTSGSLYIFRIPDLHQISKLKVFPYAVDELHCSPQNKWVFLSNTHPYILPKVFYMRSLLRTSEFSAPVSTVLEFSFCRRAFWTPRREDRITLMSRTGSPQITMFGTFDMKLEENGNRIIVAGHLKSRFSFHDYKASLKWFGVSDKNVIVFSTESSLLLFSMDGTPLQKLEYCHEIWRLWVDPLHVIVTFNDGSLEVYSWEERSQLLRRCYRLQNRKTLPPYGFIYQMLCDDMSIVQVMIDGHGLCCVMAYVLNICS